jgi:hypothetical protein
MKNLYLFCFILLNIAITQNIEPKYLELFLTNYNNYFSIKINLTEGDVVYNIEIFHGHFEVKNNNVIVLLHDDKPIGNVLLNKHYLEDGADILSIVLNDEPSIFKDNFIYLNVIKYKGDYDFFKFIENQNDERKEKLKKIQSENLSNIEQNKKLERGVYHTLKNETDSPIYLKINAETVDFKFIDLNQKHYTLCTFKQEIYDNQLYLVDNSDNRFKVSYCEDGFYFEYFTSIWLMAKVKQ